jgi:hypothetical protein
MLAPDITALQQLPAETELVSAGFPCIDVSRAGLRKGVHNGAVRLLFLCSISRPVLPYPVPNSVRIHGTCFTLLWHAILLLFGICMQDGKHNL